MHVCDTKIFSTRGALYSDVRLFSAVEATFVLSHYTLGFWLLLTGTTSEWSGSSSSMVDSTGFLFVATRVPRSLVRLW